MDYTAVVVRIVNVVSLIMVYFNRACRYGWTASGFAAYVMYAVMFRFVRAPMYMSIGTPEGDRIIVYSVFNGVVCTNRLLAATTVFMKWFDWNLKDLKWFLEKTSGVDTSSPLRVSYCVPGGLQFRSMMVDLNTLRHPVTSRPYLYGDFTLDDDETNRDLCIWCKEGTSTKTGGYLPEVTVTEPADESADANEHTFSDPTVDNRVLHEENTDEVASTDTVDVCRGGGIHI